MFGQAGTWSFLPSAVFPCYSRCLFSFRQLASGFELHRHIPSRKPDASHIEPFKWMKFSVTSHFVFFASKELDLIVRGVPEGGTHELVNISSSSCKKLPKFWHKSLSNSVPSLRVEPFSCDKIWGFSYAAYNGCSKPSVPTEAQLQSTQCMSCFGKF